MRNRKPMLLGVNLLVSAVCTLVAVGGMTMFGAPLPIAIIMGLATFGITMACTPLTKPEAGKDSENSAQEAAQRLKQDKGTHA